MEILMRVLDDYGVAGVLLIVLVYILSRARIRLRGKLEFPKKKGKQ